MFFIVRLFSYLVVRGECLFFFHVYETCLKLYPWTIVHPTSPCKYFLVNLLFYNCLLVEGSQCFYVGSLTCSIDVECLGLQEMFEGWCCFDLHQIEHSFTVCL